MLPLTAGHVPLYHQVQWKRAGERTTTHVPSWLPVVLLVLLSVVWNEWLVYHVAVSLSCGWADDGPEGRLRVFMVSDTHLLGELNGHWLDKLRREWQMRRSYSSAVGWLMPEASFFLGDLMDEGQWAGEGKLEEYAERFERLFGSVQRAHWKAYDYDSKHDFEPKTFVLFGNHDLGFHYVMKPQANSTTKWFKRRFSEDLVDVVFFGRRPFVIVTSMAMEGDGCELCREAEEALGRNSTVCSSLSKKERGWPAHSLSPILLQHFPLYRLDERECLEDRDESRNEVYRIPWDAVSEGATSSLVQAIRPIAAFDGHSHRQCTKRWSIDRINFTEYTVNSFSWRNGRVPSLLLVSLSTTSDREEPRVSVCRMPDEYVVIGSYVIMEIPSGSAVHSQINGLTQLPAKQNNLVSRFWQEVRHTAPIEGLDTDNPEKAVWKTFGKERMKTTAVALCLCLNIGTDPPDRGPRPPDRSRIQGWVNPRIVGNRAPEKIAENIQKHYEKWQGRARSGSNKVRYRAVYDPVIDDVQRMCKGLRRTAKDTRILFHYSGHGVPRPTSQGEIWVFNKNFTQYIPMSLYDLQGFLETPTIYVWDCDSAETIINTFRSFADDQESNWMIDLEEYQENGDTLPPLTSTMEYHEQAVALNYPRKKHNYKADCIQLAACRVNECVPAHPDMPADLFTACLTTPIHTSILWHLVKTGRRNEMGPIMEEIPGCLTDRKTLLGELNWIFTAITDTIAWNTLDRDLFQRLFRQDLMLASLFRSFLFAERIMGAYGSHVVSSPGIPCTADNALWASWDYTMDIALAHLNALKSGSSALFSLGRDFFINSNLMQLNPHLDLSGLMKNDEAEAQYNAFFMEQLTAFEVWLEYGIQPAVPPTQLPVVLQVLLSQTHRVRALDLLARFLDHGQWAVNYALSIGIFPYVCKLLLSNVRELKMSLAFIWAKILSVDASSKVDLFRDPSNDETPYEKMGGNRMKRELRYLYFLRLFNDPGLPPRHKIVPAYVIATLFTNEYRPAQECLTEHNYLLMCTETLMMQSERKYACSLLKLWVMIGMGQLWADYDKARWIAIRLSAYKTVMKELSDGSSEVRAGAVFALGRLVKNRTDRSELAVVVAQEIFDELSQKVSRDGSTLVREEVLVAIQYIVIDTANSLANLHRRLLEQARHLGEQEKATLSLPSSSRRRKQGSDSASVLEDLIFSMKAAEVASSSPTHSSFSSEDVAYRETTLKLISILESKSFSDSHGRTWLTVLRLSLDPIESIARKAQILVQYISDVAEQRTVKTSELLLSMSSADLSRRPPPRVETPLNGDSDDVDEGMDVANSPPDHSGVLFTVGSPMTRDPVAILKQSLALFSCPPSNSMDTPLGPSRKYSCPSPRLSLNGSGDKGGTSSPIGSVTREKDGFAFPFSSTIGFHEYSRKRYINMKEMEGTKTQKAIDLEKKEEKERMDTETEHQPILIETQFVPWCSSRFILPIREFIMAEFDSDSEEDSEWRDEDKEEVLTMATPTDWALCTEEGMRQLAEKDEARVEEKPEISGEHRGSWRRMECSRKMVAAAFSPLRPFLYCTDGVVVETLSTEQSRMATVNSFPVHGGNPFSSDTATWIEAINPLSTEMIMTGSSNGIVRVFNPFYNVHSISIEQPTTLVTAAYPLSEQPRTKAECRGVDHTLYEWSQSRGELLCTGNVKVCRVWDARSEKSSLDLPTGGRGAVVAMGGLLQSNLVALGFRDGRILLHDTRLVGKRPLALSLVDAAVASVAMRSENGDLSRCILSALSSDGVLYIWEPRMYQVGEGELGKEEGEQEPVATIRLVEEEELEEGNHDMSMAVHSNSKLVGISTGRRASIRGWRGEEASSPRIPSCPIARPRVLAFHPYKSLLALSHISPSDSFVSIFGPQEIPKKL